MSADEKKAFLVDVKSPLVTGTYTVKARASASEPDPFYDNNHASVVTLLP